MIWLRCLPLCDTNPETLRGQVRGSIIYVKFGPIQLDRHFAGVAIFQRQQRGIPSCVGRGVVAWCVPPG